MSTLSQYNDQPTSSFNDTLIIALFAAVIIHVLIISGVSFTLPQPEKINKSINITISTTPSEHAPEKSEYLAPDNQHGAGAEKLIKPPVQKLPKQHSDQGKQNALKKNPATEKPAASKKVIAQKKIDMPSQTTAKPSKEVSKNQPQLTQAALARQVAQLGAEIRYSQQSSEKSRIKFVNSVSTHKYLASQYILDWQQKVEKTGNMNYPEVARKKNYTGKLTMDVGIKHDGSIYSIRINQSSGYQALDEAAKNIVRMSAPFAPLPKELRKELDVLIITRVWQFSDESGMSAQ